MLKVPMRQRGHSADEAAEHISLSPRRFFALVAEGAIPRANRRGYVLKDVRRAYFRHLRAAVAEHDEAAESSLVGQRAALTREVREALSIKSAISRAEFIPVGTIRRQLAAMFPVLRKRAMAICEIAPALEFKTRAEVESALRTEVYAALNEMCDPPRGPHAGPDPCR